MPYDDVQKFSEAAVNKAKLLKEHPGKYFLRAVMAGFFIVVAMICLLYTSPSPRDA